MKLALLICIGISFVLNSVVLGYVYPDVSTDYNQFIEYVRIRNIVYEIMFAAFFFLSYALSEGFFKSVACFFAILAFGSAIDKMMGITWYLKSDIILLIISFTVSTFVYVRELRIRN